MTGTGTDALENKRRQRRLMRMIEEREKNEDQALVTGIYSGFQNSSVLDGIGIPECVPILIIVPSSVIKVCKFVLMQQFFPTIKFPNFLTTGFTQRTGRTN